MTAYDEPVEDIPVLSTTTIVSEIETAPPAPSEQMNVVAEPELATIEAGNNDRAEQEIPAPIDITLIETLPGQLQLSSAQITSGIPLSPTNQLPPQIALPPQHPAKKRLDIIAIGAIIAAILLLLLGSGGLIYNFTYYQPHKAMLGATATANFQINATANSNATEGAATLETATVQTQATTQAEQDLYTQATSGSPLVTDSLQQQSTNGWDDYTENDSSSCRFKDGSYHSYAPVVGYFMPCYEENRVFSNFALQVNFTIITGDFAGLVFRSHYNNYCYLFTISPSGYYYLYVYNGPKASNSKTLFSSHTGGFGNQQAQLTVITIGHELYFYLNQYLLTSITDKALQSGLIALVADDIESTTDVAFNNLKIWLIN